MDNLFLKAKHWHLFSITVGLPFLIQLAFISQVAFSLTKEPNPEEISTLLQGFSFLPFVVLPFYGVMFLWQWSVLFGFKKQFPQHVERPIVRIKLFMLFPALYIIVMTAMVSSFINSMFERKTVEDITYLGSMVILIIPLHLFAMFCIFHTLFWVAKSYKTVELQRKTSFSEFTAEFFLIWFFPIGIWILQPKINQLISSNTPIKEESKSTFV